MSRVLPVDTACLHARRPCFHHAARLIFYTPYVNLNEGSPLIREVSSLQFGVNLRGVVSVRIWTLPPPEPGYGMRLVGSPYFGRNGTRTAW